MTGTIHGAIASERVAVTIRLDAPEASGRPQSPLRGVLEFPESIEAPQWVQNAVASGRAVLAIHGDQPAQYEYVLNVLSSPANQFYAVLSAEWRQF